MIFLIMNDNIINVYHNDWKSIIIIENNVLYKENSIDQKISDYFINNHFLKITWNINCVDYFLSSDNKNYYQYCDKYNHIFLKITHIIISKIIIKLNYI